MEYAMTRKALGIAALAAAFATAALQMAQAELTPEAARQVLAGVEGAVVSVRIQSRTIMTMEGRESSREESESEATGCVVNAKGLTAVSLSAVDPGSLYSDLMKSTGGDGFDMRHLMTVLGEREITSVLIEGGGTTHASAFEAGIVDKVMFFVAPKVIGGRDAITAVEGEGVATMDEAVLLERMTAERVGDDLLIEAYVKAG